MTVNKVEGKHYTPEFGLNDEGVTTEDGKYTYWRPSIGMMREHPYGIFRKRWHCVCGKVFKNPDAMELHYRKAYEEEKMVATIPIKTNYQGVGNECNNYADMV